MLLGSDHSIPAVKLVILGNSGVGKTSLINQWINGSNLQNPKPTIGAVNHMQRLTYDDQDVDLFIWDTAGQEQFSSLAPLYVRSTNVGIVVADISDKESFNEVDKWVDIVRTENPTLPPLVLAINKIDLDSKVYSESDVITRFTQQFAKIFFVSATTGYKVDQLFTEAGRLGTNFVLSFNSNSNHIVVGNPKQNQKSGCC
ncbi:small GTP-binding protein, putative [Trichomonas vaginalis G3]|uniref:Small GTP-binding protein, putative n=1 Tax=Trichomonas vaginalis (strain ATCC PRA-98 / G3) TaxID=412133 RepID=A2FWF3_TRIV3|nr:GTPase protein [Trichomonas vaginalis G3]EAX90780.1 small GTP-binding protein, putative [Trichomonas vaginalis G3]KAI5529757.1 GTPase protein [Trichomonas vaginalis G3]|eukprot:XP_001303710.1 small GTP-binding protein [Trichomonas vaginalis G3]